MALQNRLYPHLLPDDIEVWERFLLHFQSLFDWFDYDVRVGEGRAAPPDLHRVIQRMALDLSKRRIDAVGYFGPLRTIIEITTGIGFTAIGQIQVYPNLYRDTFTDHGPLRVLIVGSHLQPDIEGPLKQIGIPWVTIDKNEHVAQSGHLIL